MSEGDCQLPNVDCRMNQPIQGSLPRITRIATDPSQGRVGHEAAQKRTKKDIQTGVVFCDLLCLFVAINSVGIFIRVHLCHPWLKKFGGLMPVSVPASHSLGDGWCLFGSNSWYE